MDRMDSQLLRVVSSQIEPDICVLTFSGNITMGPESREIEERVKELLRQNRKKFIFDLAGVDYVDSTGMGTIAYCFATVMRAGGGFRVAGADGRVRHLMKITRLDTVLAFYPTVAAAAQDFLVSPGEQNRW